MTTTVKFEGYLDREHIILEVTNGETYTPNLSQVYIVQATYAEDVNGYINAVIDTSDNRTITFYVTGGSNKNVYVTIYGRK